MRMMTGTLGGIIRDVIAREPSVLLRQEVYVGAGMAGALGCVACAWLGLPLSVAAGAGFVLALAIRGVAIPFGRTLPADKSRPGRDPRDLE